MKLKVAISNLTDVLFLIRPVLLVPVWGFAAFGYWKSAGGNIYNLPQFWFSIPLKFYIWILVFSLSVGAVYILNQIADIEVDKKNGGKPLIASGVVSRSVAMIFAGLLAGVSILVPLLFSHTVLALLSVSALLTGIIYSFRPTFFSGKPLLDFFTNAMGYGVIAFGAGWSLSGKSIFTQDFVVSSTPYFLLMCAGSISSTLSDRSGDMQEGKNTTAVVFGNARAHLLATFFLLGAESISIVRADYIAAFCAVVSFPFYLGYIMAPNKFWMESTYKVGGALSMICAGLIMPLIIPSALVVFLVTRLYFRIRHGISYPQLTRKQNET